MIRLVFFCFLLLLGFSTSAKPKDQIAKKYLSITYETRFNGVVDTLRCSILEISDSMARVYFPKFSSAPLAPEETLLMDFHKGLLYKHAVLANKEVISTKGKIVDLIAEGAEQDRRSILGYECKKIVRMLNSNRFEIWYTEQLGGRGSMQPQLGIPQGVVLRVDRNGQLVEEAVNIERKGSWSAPMSDKKGEDLEEAVYRYRLQQSSVIRVPIFVDESVYYNEQVKPTALSDTDVYRFANGTLLVRKMHLPELTTPYSVFVELSHYSKGDAYDRTGSVFVIPVDKKRSFLDGLRGGLEQLPVYSDVHGNSYQGICVTEEYDPPLELMRFYTSFGTRTFNHIQYSTYQWPDSILYKQDVSDYSAILRGEVWIGTWIGNYDKGGHHVSLQLKYYPGEGDHDKQIYPLFATVNLMEMQGQSYPEALFRQDSLQINFTTKEDLKNASIRYIATGHGGWGGGDEFNPKRNEIFLDGQRIFSYTPWRDDCGSYRDRNPASGNFSNGMSSSDYSRSGWCPGMISVPIQVYIGDLKAGEHLLRVAIPVGQPEGSSRSYWCISGALVGEK